MINSDRARILVDWDNDSWLNIGVKTDTPKNLFPSAPYVGQAFLRGIQHTSGLDLKTDVPDVNDHGLTRREIPFGWTGSADYATKCTLGMGTFHEYQPLEGEYPNLLDNSMNFAWTGSYVTRQNKSSNSVNINVIYNSLTSPDRVYGRRHIRFDASPGIVIGMSIGGGASAEYVQAGYHDGSNQYSKAVDGSHAGTFEGWAVSASTNYTLVYWIRQPTVGTTIKVRLYGNGGSASTPNYGRQYITGEDFTATTSFVKHSYNFTTPSGCTQLALDFQGNINTDLAGFMLISGNHVPSRFYDNQIVFSEDQFDYTLKSGKAYVLSFWVKSPDGVTKITGVTREARIGTNTIDVINNSHQITVTSSWTRVNISLTSQAYDRAYYGDFTAEKSGTPCGLNTVGTVYFSGFMLTEGTGLNHPYNAGVITAYDDVSPYVLNFTTRSGKSSFEDLLAYEGTAEIPLNNNSKVFSPNNTSSPLYGYLKQNRRVYVQLWDTAQNAYRTIWTGWTRAFTVTPGSNDDNQTILHCEQGIFRLADGQLPATVQEDLGLDDAIKLVVGSTGWIPATQHPENTEGINTLASVNAFTVDDPDLYSTFEETFHTYEVVGQDWAKDKEPRAALEEVLEAESAMMWLDRNGRFYVANREHWIKTTSGDDEFKLGDDVISTEYAYGEDIVNQVDVRLEDKKGSSNGVVWKMKRPIQLSGRRHGTPKRGFNQDTRLIDVNAEFQEKRSRTILSVSDENITKEVWLVPPNKYGQGGTQATPELEQGVSVDLIQDHAGRYQLKVVNTNVNNVWVRLEVSGNYVETGDRKNVSIEETDAIYQSDGVYHKSITNGLIDSLDQAESLAQFSLLRQSTPVGEFKSINLDANDDAMLQRIFALEIGDFLDLSETQTGESHILHTIIGENFDFNGNDLKVSYDLAYIEKTSYALADVAVTEPETLNYIADMGNIVPLGNAQIGYEDWQKEGIDKLQYVQLDGAYEILWLSPHPRQMIYIDPKEHAFWPEFSTTGVRTDTNRGGIYRPVGRSSPATYPNGDAGYNRYTYKFMPLMAGDYAARTDGTVFYGSGAVGGVTAWRLFAKGMPRNNQYLAASSDNDVDLMLRLIPDKKYRKYAYTRTGSTTAPEVVVMTKAGGVEHLSAWGSLVDADTFATRSMIDIPGGGTLSLAEIRARRATSGTLTEWACLMMGGGGTDLYTHLWNLWIIQMQDIGSIYLDSAQSHKYACYLRVAPECKSQSYTLTVYDTNGAVVGTSAATISKTTPTKLEVNIPSGNTWVYATLHKTTEDFVDDKIYVYGYGITPSSPTSYLDYYTDSPNIAYTYI